MTKIMRTLHELGQALADRRKARGLKQGKVAEQSGLSRSSIVPFWSEGNCQSLVHANCWLSSLFLGWRLTFTEVGKSGTLDELRRERGGTA